MRSNRSSALRSRLLISLLAIVGIGAAVPFASNVNAAGAPIVTAGPASGLTASSADVSATINPNGQATTYAFQFGTTTGYGSQTSVRSAGSDSTNHAVSSTITGLRAGTTYHYRAIATNASGTTVGTDAVFTTSGPPPPPPPKPPPAAVTGPATNVNLHGATLRGSVNPRGAKTAYYFDLGPTAFYGLQTKSKLLAAGNRPLAVRSALTGLQSGQTYHYRLVARNTSGTTLGADRTFSTATSTPVRAVPALTARTTPKRDRRRPFRFRTRGKLIPPAGISRSRACRGRVAVRFKAGRRTISLRTVGVSRHCRYRARVTLRARRLHGRKKLRVAVRFGGNAVLKPKSAPTKSVRVG
jgi:hypothetical protein